MLKKGFHVLRVGKYEEKEREYTCVHQDGFYVLEVWKGREREIDREKTLLQL